MPLSNCFRTRVRFPPPPPFLHARRHHRYHNCRAGGQRANQSPVDCMAIANSDHNALYHLVELSGCPPVPPGPAGLSRRQRRESTAPNARPDIAPSVHLYPATLLPPMPPPKKFGILLRAPHPSVRWAKVLILPNRLAREHLNHRCSARLSETAATSDP